MEGFQLPFSPFTHLLVGHLVHHRAERGGVVHRRHGALTARVRRRRRRAVRPRRRGEEQAALQGDICASRRARTNTANEYSMAFVAWPAITCASSNTASSNRAPDMACASATLGNESYVEKRMLGPPSTLAAASVRRNRAISAASVVRFTRESPSLATTLKRGGWGCRESHRNSNISS